MGLSTSSYPDWIDGIFLFTTDDSIGWESQYLNHSHGP
jgi:hypothetical protein